jgi:hypothetical protein
MVSAETVQSALTGGVSTRARYVAERDYLINRRLKNKQLDVDRPGEAYCEDCECRITVTSDGLELGHDAGLNGSDGQRCTHRPDSVDPGTIEDLPGGADR